MNLNNTTSPTEADELDKQVLDIYTGIGLGEYSTEDLKAFVQEHTAQAVQKELEDILPSMDDGTPYQHIIQERLATLSNTTNQEPES